MMRQTVQLLSETEYASDPAVRLFEDDHCFSYGKIQLEKTSLKFAWNSKGISPDVKFVKGTTFVFIGVDTYVVGYDIKSFSIVFFLTTASNFKWFEEIDNGIGIVAETEIILLNATARCTLRDCFFFEDIIMGTRVDKDGLMINFLGVEDKFLRI